MICMEPLNNGQAGGVQATACMHTFHKNCLDQALHVKPNCPECRTPLDPDNYGPVGDDEHEGDDDGEGDDDDEGGDDDGAEEAVLRDAALREALRVAQEAARLRDVAREAARMREEAAWAREIVRLREVAREEARLRGIAQEEARIRAAEEIRIRAEVTDADLLQLARYRQIQQLLSALAWNPAGLDRWNPAGLDRELFVDADGVDRAENVIRRIVVTDRILHGRDAELSAHDIADYRDVFTRYRIGLARAGLYVGHLPVAVPIQRTRIQRARDLGRRGLLAVWNRVPNMPRFGCTRRRARRVAYATGAVLGTAMTLVNTDTSGAAVPFGALTLGAVYKAIQN